MPANHIASGRAPVVSNVQRSATARLKRTVSALLIFLALMLPGTLPSLTRFSTKEPSSRSNTLISFKRSP